MKKQATSKNKKDENKMHSVSQKVSIMMPAQILGSPNIYAPAPMGQISGSITWDSGGNDGNQSPIVVVQLEIGGWLTFIMPGVDITVDPHHGNETITHYHLKNLPLNHWFNILVTLPFKPSGSNTILQRIYLDSNNIPMTLHFPPFPNPQHLVWGPQISIY